MFLIQSETDLLNAFRPRDRKQFEPPPNARFPLLVREYRAWSDPSGFRTFLILNEPRSGRPMGIVFERSHGGGTPVSQMCDWCHSHGTSNEIGLLTAEASSRRHIGVNVCLDLRCAEKLEEQANLTGKNAKDLIARVAERMVRFADEGLGIRFVPAP